MAAINWEVDTLIIICSLCVLSIVLSFILTSLYCFKYEVPTEYSFEKRPSLFILYIKALAVALFRKRKHGVINKGQTSDPVKPEDRRNKVTALDCRIDIANLDKYCKVCGYQPETLTIPPCYLETYFLPLLIGVITSDDFKLSPLGLIHIRQTITQHASLQHLLKEPFDLECTILEYRSTGRGVEVDAGFKVFDRREMCLWEGVATLLSRNSASRSSGGRSHKAVTACVENGRQTATEVSSSGHVRNGVTVDTPLAEETAVDTRILNLPADLGVQYAKVSGDWNPHHLWGWSARLLGYKRPIAHGMWNMARCLTWLETTGKFSILPPFQVDVQFKRPMFLPGSSLFSCFRQIDKNKFSFRVNDEVSGAPQLIGLAKRL